MTDLLPYFAVFWALGIILMGLFVRLYLRKHRQNPPAKHKRKLPTIVLLCLAAGMTGQPASARTSETVAQSAQALLNPDSARSFIHPSAWLRDIVLHGSELPPEIQHELIKRGFKSPFFRNSRESVTTRSEADGLNLSADNGLFRVHFTTGGSKGVDPADANANSIPDYIDTVLIVLNEVYTREITGLGYYIPPDDGNYAGGSDNGGSAHYDIYVTNLPFGYYGYVQGEQSTGNNPNSPGTETNAYTSYMAIRNDYSGFPNTRINNLRVTIAHEFFHAVQYGYDAWEEPWLMEATAVWVEEAVYDNINDCYQYLPTWFAAPQIGINSAGGNHWYGSYILFEYLASHLGGPDVITRIWEASINHNSAVNDDSRLIITEALNATQSRFADALVRMVIANRILSSSSLAGIYRYPEAETWPVYPTGPATFKIELFNPGNIDTVTSSNLEAFGSQYVFLHANFPVRVELLPDSGPVTDFTLSAILRDNAGGFHIRSGPSMNIDLETNGYEWMYLAVTGIGEDREDFDFRLVFSDGTPEDSNNGAKDVAEVRIYPNPMLSKSSSPADKLTIQFQSINAVNATARIINLKGQTIAEVFTELLSVDQSYIYQWNGKTTAGILPASGQYFLILETPNQIETRSFILIR